MRMLEPPPMYDPEPVAKITQVGRWTYYVFVGSFGGWEASVIGRKRAEKKAKKWLKKWKQEQARVDNTWEIKE